MIQFASLVLFQIVCSCRGVCSLSFSKCACCYTVSILVILLLAGIWCAFPPSPNFCGESTNLFFHIPKGEKPKWWRGSNWNWLTQRTPIQRHARQSRIDSNSKLYRPVNSPVLSNRRWGNDISRAGASSFLFDPIYTAKVLEFLLVETCCMIPGTSLTNKKVFRGGKRTTVT